MAKGVGPRELEGVSSTSCPVQRAHTNLWVSSDLECRPMLESKEEDNKMNLTTKNMLFILIIWTDNISPKHLKKQKGVVISHSNLKMYFTNALFHQGHDPYEGPSQNTGPKFEWTINTSFFSVCFQSIVIQHFNKVCYICTVFGGCVCVKQNVWWCLLLYVLLITDNSFLLI